MSWKKASIILGAILGILILIVAGSYFYQQITNQQPVERELNNQVAEYKNIVAKDPKNLSAWLILADLERQLKNYDSAIESYKKALELDSSSSIILNNLANVYKDKGVNNEAEALYKKAIEKDTYNILAYLNYNDLLTTQGKVKDSINLLLQGIKNNPKNADLYAALGKSYEKDNQPTKAKDAYKKALQLDPKNEEASKALKNL